MCYKMVKSLVLILGFAVYGGVIASPARLPQNMIPTYFPATQSQHYNNFQPHYRFRPVGSPLSSARQFRPRSYPNSWSKQQQFRPDSRPVDQRIAAAPQFRPQPYPYSWMPPQQYWSANRPINRLAYAPSYRTGAYPNHHRPQVAAAYPVPGYLGRYQYPNPAYGWRPGYAFNPSPMMARSPYRPTYSGMPIYGYQPGRFSNPAFVQNYFPTAPYRNVPVYYGNNSGMAYRLNPMQPVPAHMMAGSPSNHPRLGMIPHQYNPYHYAPGQNLMVNTGMPIPRNNPSVGRYLSGYGVNSRHLSGGPNSLYRFRPDPKFSYQQPVSQRSAMQYRSREMPMPSANQETYLPARLDGEKYVWRPLEAAVGDDLY